MATVQLSQTHGVLLQGLPQVCMRCGAAASRTVHHTFLWTPEVIPNHPLDVVGVLASELSAIERDVEVPLCNRHRHHFAITTHISYSLCVLSLFVLALSLVCLVVLKWKESPHHDLVLVVLALPNMAILAAWGCTVYVLPMFQIRLTTVTPNSISLRNVSPRFVEAVAEQNRFASPQG